MNSAPGAPNAPQDSAPSRARREPGREHGRGAAPQARPGRTRRRPLVAALLALGVVAACTSTPKPDAALDLTSDGGSPVAAVRRPNIVLIYADDMGYGDLPALNPAAVVPTPHLDRLVAEGLLFRDAHSSSAICTPSRYALLTGRHHWRDFHGIVDSFGPSVFAPGRLTLAELLADQGYATACVGKWHLGWDWAALRRDGAAPLEQARADGFPAEDFDWSRPIPDGPLAHGFEHYFGDDVPNFPPYGWIEDERLLVAPSVAYAPHPAPREGAHEGRPGPMVAGWRLDAVMPTLADHAVTWLEARADDPRPFFLYLPWTAPHAPIVPPPAWQGRTAAGGYGDFLALTDACTGRVLEALERLDLADDTLVVFTSDNGPEHYAYERVRRSGHRSAGALRGLKRDVFEGGHRVPFVVRWPGVVPAGAVSDALVGQVDLLATLAAALDVPLPDDAAEDSFDLGPLWRGEADAVRDSMVHNTFADRWALRQGDWLLIDGPDGAHTRVPAWFADQEGLQPGGGDVLLFDLARDPGQRDDRSAQEPARVAAMTALLARLRASQSSAPRLDDGGEPGDAP